jgi:hypothetical protein
MLPVARHHTEKQKKMQKLQQAAEAEAAEASTTKRGWEGLHSD